MSTCYGCDKPLTALQAFETQAAHGRPFCPDCAEPIRCDGCGNDVPKGLVTIDDADCVSCDECRWYLQAELLERIHGPAPRLRVVG